MNPEDQEKAIAEVCGVQPELVEWWAYKEDGTGGRICMSAPTKDLVEKWIKENPVYAEGFTPKAFYRYPAYTLDFNAMHKAYTHLGRHWEVAQVEDGYVCKIQFGPRNKDVIVAGLELLPVMSEAFLRTFGRWMEMPLVNASVLAQPGETSTTPENDR
jgi:hypothetical protein